MNKTLKQVALFLMVGLIILAIFQLNQPSGDTKFISYSDFIAKSKNGEILKVTIENDKKITGFYRPKPIDPPAEVKNTANPKKQAQDVAVKPETTKDKTPLKTDGVKEKKASTEKFDFWTSIPYSDPKLIETLVASNISVEGKDNDDNMFLKGIISFLPWLIFFGLIWFLMMRQIQGAGNKALSFGKSRAKLSPETKKKYTYADVAGADEAKEELKEIVDFLMDPKKFLNIGARIPSGVLLVGPPGTGKTLLARAVSGEAGVPFFSISGSDFVEMFVGVGAARVRDLFEQGKKSAPCIIFIDEIDAVGRLRGAGLGGGHDEREQTLNQLLVEMDGFEKNEGVIIIAATNRPDVLDPALLRPGRFDRQVVVDIPDIRGREKILAVHSKKVPLSKEVDLKIIARGTPGFTGADLANLINEAALLAARKNKKRVAMVEMEEAKDKVMMGPERRSIIISVKEKEIIAYHEAGHTILGLMTGNDPVHKVTIIPRGRALGLTMQLPLVEKHLHSKSYWINQIMVLFGGYLAEELKFKEITTGSSNDLERASNIARKMICEWGMSKKLGLLTFGRKNEQIFLGREISQHRDYSENTADLIDGEVNEIFESCRKEARKILSSNVAKLDSIAKNLIERETLTGDEILLLMKGKKLPPLQSAIKTEEEEESKEIVANL